MSEANGNGEEHADPADPDPMDLSAVVPLPGPDDGFYHATRRFIVPHPEDPEKRVQLGHQTACAIRMDMGADDVRSRREFEEDTDREPCPLCYGLTDSRWLERTCVECGRSVLQPVHLTSPTFCTCTDEGPQMVPAPLPDEERGN